MTDEPGYGDDLEYYPSNATVRFVSARRGDEPAAYDAMPFEQWASIECAEVSLERTRAVTAERLGTDEFGSGMGRPPEPFAADGLVVRLHVATVVEDGERAATPTVDLSTLADAAPAHVSATVSLEGEEFSREVPVFADHVTIGFG